MAAKKNLHVFFQVFLITISFKTIAETPGELTEWADQLTNEITVFDKEITFHKNGHLNKSSRTDSLIYTGKPGLFKEVVINIDSIWKVCNKNSSPSACTCGLKFCAKVKFEFTDNRKVIIYWTCPSSPLQCFVYNNRNETFEFTLVDEYAEDLKKDLADKRYEVFSANKVWDCLYIDLLEWK